jgi:hypothetical protein
MPAAAVEQIGKIIGQDATFIPHIAIRGFRFSDASSEVLSGGCAWPEACLSGAEPHQTQLFQQG